MLGYLIEARIIALTIVYESKGVKMTLHHTPKELMAELGKAGLRQTLTLEEGNFISDISCA
jgi:hypothetical protein